TSNTPKHVLLYEALNVPPPKFAHVPLIFGADRKRLSKRHGATSVAEFQHMGYLPDALVNFLALLGWSPGEDREMLTRDEMVQAFTLEGVSGGNAVFDQKKLDWFNSRHIELLQADEIIDKIQPLLEESKLWREEYASVGDSRTWLASIINLLKSRATVLPDFIEYGRPFLVDEVTYEPEAVKKRLLVVGLADHVAALREAYAALEEDRFDSSSLERVLRGIADSRSIKAGVLIHATRVAMTGTTVSPSLFEMVELMGRAKTISRLKTLEQFLAEQPPLDSLS
ncbi:MAG: glutamate--tRNA ligase family protein, partial [Acidobacteriota bacterium]|nr:glutamate--tRNA ligase family protein [Acidobacteriota bacterium]